MPRDVPKSNPARRSQRWMQFFVNEQPAILNHAVRQATGIAPQTDIHWKSPLADDDFAEYFDQAFLNRLQVTPSNVPLNEFWPNGGPHWDGLAITSTAEVILVEAKANITEFATDPCGAESAASIEQIRKSLNQVQQFMDIRGNRCRPELWFNAFYQYANRLAHLYFLREVNGIPTHLIFLDIVNDPDSGNDAVKSADEWKSLTRLAETCLGITSSKPLMQHVHHIHVDVTDFA
ncbi:MAG: hypothetical protein JSS02_33535 [Planctomycetes bacterium]|nr:hypothetical protein [Planctomycetota bacterium]